MTISKSWFSYLTRAFALSLCTALLLNFVSCSDSSTSQEPKVVTSTYTVKHLLQNLQDDNYTEDEEAAEQKTGTYGTQTAAAAKTYEGFTAQTFEQATIQADGSTVVEIKYDRNTYTVSYSSTYGEPPESKTVKYGYVLTTEDLPVLPDTILSFNGWRLDGVSIAAGYTVKKDITLTAQWKAPLSVTKENFSAVIATLTEDSTIVVTGELTDSDLPTLKTAIKNSSYKVNLDLSQTTGLTSIPKQAFYYCASLSSVTIPDSVTSIGYCAFYGCTSLSSVTIGNSVTSIDAEAFEGCSSLSSVTIPDSVTSIYDFAFRHCTSLSSITIPDSVTSIGLGAFERCTSLSSVTIGNSVTSIGDYAFYDCSKLTSLTFTDPTNWYRTDSTTNWIDKTNGTLTDVSDPARNAVYFTTNYYWYFWYKLDD